jgi:NADH-quinone oxidoreductase subunit M
MNFSPDILPKLLVFLPIAGGLLLLAPKPGPKFARQLAIFWSLATLLVSVLIACPAVSGFHWDSSASQLQTHHEWFPSLGIEFAFGVDSISLCLALLTTLLSAVVIYGAPPTGENAKERNTEFYLWLLVLESALLGTFMARDAIFFYICFEFTLIPVFFLIGSWGGTLRHRAALTFFIYTFVGSIFTFAALMYVAYFNSHLEAGVLPNAHRWTFNFLDLYAAGRLMDDTQQMWVLAGLMAGFAVKIPIFPFHTWLPLTYSQSPTAATVMLAGVLAKMGTYGLIRIVIPMAPLAVTQVGPVIGSLAIIGTLYTALICWSQKDVKKLLGYSSISHLGFCVFGLFAINSLGAAGSVVHMVNHGLSTGGLFLCMAMMTQRFNTREIDEVGGLAKLMPKWAFFTVFFALASIGLPGLNGFVGEFFTLQGVYLSGVMMGPWYAASAAVAMILGAIYMLYLLGKIVFGPLHLPTHTAPTGDVSAATTPAPVISDLCGRECATLFPLAALCLGLGLFPSPMFNSIRLASDHLILPATSVLAQPYEAPIRINPKDIAARDAARPRTLPVTRPALDR